MSDALRDIEAKLLAGRLNQRARLLAIAAGKKEGRTWLRPSVVCVVIGAAGFICSMVSATESSDRMSLVNLVLTFVFLMDLLTEHFNDRMAALIELLQQDGQLQGTPPPLAISPSKSPVRPSNLENGLNA
jgi:hypothetical protein